VIDLFVVYQFSQQKSDEATASAKEKTRLANARAVGNTDLEGELENIVSQQDSEIGSGENEDDEENCCCICLGDYEDEEELRMLPCLHAFHKECIDSWLRINAICPMCKKDVQTMLAEKISLGTRNSMSPTPSPPEGAWSDGGVGDDVGAAAPSAFSLRQAQLLGQSSYSEALGSNHDLGSGSGGGSGAPQPPPPRAAPPLPPGGPQTPGLQAEDEPHSESVSDDDDVHSLAA
jgi:hypothetical protein